MLKVEDILDKIILPLNETFIILFCDDKDVQRDYGRAMNEFIKIANSENVKEKEFIEAYDKVKKILIDNEDVLDISKLILALLYDLNKELEAKKIRIGQLVKAPTQIFGTESVIDRLGIESEIAVAKKLGKNINMVLSQPSGNPEENKYELLVLDSEEMIHNRKRKSNIGKLSQINEKIKGHQIDDGEVVSGLEMVLIYLNDKDIEQIFFDEHIGKVVKRVLVDNQILRQVKDKDENGEEIKLDVLSLEKIKTEDREKYDGWTKEIHYEDIESELKKIIEEHNKYVDFNKLLLISAYRYQEYLEKNLVISEDIDEYASILSAILSMVKSRSVTIYGTLDNQNLEVSYDVEKLKDCLKRFTSKGFLTKENVNEIKKEVKTGQRVLSSLDDEKIDAIFSNDELEQLAQLNDKNFIYVLRNLKWKKEKIINKISSMENISGFLLETFLSDGILDGKDIIDLYIRGIISIDQINIISKIFDLSNVISEQKLYELYINLDRGNAEDREKSKREYEQYLAAYRIIFKDSEKEMQSTYSENLVEKIIEKNGENDAIKYFREFIVNEVTTPDEMIKWCGKEKFAELVLDCYQNNLISAKRISYLVKKDTLSKDKVNNRIINPNISHEQRMELIKKGLADIKTIEILYRSNLLYYDDINQLIETGIVDGLQMVKIINGVSLEERTKNSKISLGDSFEEIPLTERFFVNTKRIIESNKNLIIDPKAKETMYSLLGAKRATDISISKDSAFCNYHFYIIPNESGEISAESIVIAEPTDKGDSRDRMPTQDKSVPTINENAEVFCCKYGDLMVLDNYVQKNGEFKEIKNTVHKVENSITTEKKRGSWGIDLVYAVIKTMASSDLEYPEGKEEERSSEAVEILNRRYSPKQIKKILNFIKQIDTGRCNCEAPKKYIDEVSTDDEEQDL